MTVKSIANVGIVVENIQAAIDFFTELGLTLEGRATVEGDWADRVTGLRDMRVEIAMMVTPDGHGRLELSRFLAPSVVADHRDAPVNALGYLRVMFTVEDLDETLSRLLARGAQLVDEVVQYEDVFRLPRSGAWPGGGVFGTEGFFNAGPPDPRLWLRWPKGIAPMW